MKRMVGLMAVCLARTASAGGNEPGYDLGQVADWLIDAKKDYRSGATSAPPPTACSDALAAMGGGAVAVWPNANLEKFGGVSGTKGYTISLGNAEKLCAEANLLKGVVLKDFDLFKGIVQDLDLLGDTSIGTGVANVTKENAAKCVTAVDAILAAGVSASYPYVLKNGDGKAVTNTVGDLKPKVCQAGKKASEKQVADVEAEAKAYEARLTKAGLAGDKLEWFKHYDGQVFLAGGAAPSDLKQYATASVWFAYIYSSDPDSNGNHEFTLRRYQFAGSKLTKRTEKIYRKPLIFKNRIGSVMK